MSGYAEIAAEFRQKITNGDMSPGDGMPSYKELSSLKSVNRTTAIRAYDVLESEGLIVRAPGKPAVVAHRPRVVVTGPGRLARMEKGGPQYEAGEETRGHFAALRSCADVSVCRALGIESHGEIVFRRRTFTKGGEALSIGINYIHMREFASVPEVAQQGRLATHWQTLYTERTGKRINRSQPLATARHASTDELEAMGISVPEWSAVPVLVVWTTFHDEDGPLEVWEDVYAPGKWAPIGAPNEGVSA